MRPATIPLTATLALLCAASAAPAPASAAPSSADAGLRDAGLRDAGLRDAATEAFDRWLTAAASLRDARDQLGEWLDAGPAFIGGIQRATVYFHVRLRHALAAGERWVAAIVEQTTDASVPDLTVLVAEPVKGIESSGFGWRVDPINNSKKFHKGTDYRADRGTPVYAAGPGVVAFCGRQQGYGNVIYLDHGGGLVTRYAHLKKIGVHNGDTVSADDLIGQVGSTGRTTGPHLHFEIRLDGRAVDPVLAMHIAALQRTEPPAVARLAAMALLPEVQTQSVDRHDPPPGHRRRNRPERSGRHTSRRDRPSS